MAALGVVDVRSVVDRVCARPDVLEACRNRDLGQVIRALYDAGLSQGRMAALSGGGLTQGRVSEYMHGKRHAMKASLLDNFATGLGFPAYARRALGLAAEPPSAAVTLVTPGSTSLDAGLAFPDSPDDTTETVTGLWHGDLEDPGEPQQRAIDPRAWGTASLKWLVASPSSYDNDKMGHGGRVGLSDVQRFRATVDMFVQLDDRFGGGNARQALIQYLATDADRLLRGRFNDEVARELYYSVSEATLLAAWMTYDSTPASGLAQRYFVQALALAKAAGTNNARLLGASILDAMSHQATYTGRFTYAADLARAARTGTIHLATPTLTAHFHVMEARALARLGDAKACDRAMAEAIRVFEHRNPQDDPEWIRYFDDTEMNAELGHCLRDLGRTEDAAQHAKYGFITNPDASAFGRSDFFVAVVLADSHLANGDVGKACDVALKALGAGDQIRSARCIGYLREFDKHLTPVDSPVVAGFREKASESRLWRIATRSATA
jgi:hypothetical protein